MAKNRFFGNGDANLHILQVKDTCHHFKIGLMMLFDPENIGREALIFQISLIRTEI